MTNSIKNIVLESISQAQMEASSYNRSFTLEDVKVEINCIVEFMSFDTVTAKNMFLGFIETELQATVSFLYPAKMQMDENGTYTTNSKLWA